jgi:hypothetical protein
VKEFLASLDIVTSSASIAEVTAILGTEAAGSSHDKGSPRFDGTWEKTIWKLESPEPEAAPIERHLDSLLQELARIGRERLSRLPPDAEMTLTVGILCYGPMCSFVIPRKFMGMIYALGLDLELDWYLTSSDDNASPDTSTPSSEGEV